MKIRSLRLNITIFLGILGVLGHLQGKNGAQPEKPVTVRVFIHGTILAGYFFLDLSGSWSDSFRKNCRLERTVRATRKDASLHYAELVLDEGLQDITREVSDHTQPLHHDKAAIALVRTFHRTARACGIDKGPVHYYTFGWSGALSETWRNLESELLYTSLAQLNDEFHVRYPGQRVKIELYAHSHGGQLVAHLATIHKKHKHPRLHIDLAVLCATPIYKEKVQPMTSSSLFSMILNMHSYGDKVQTIDFISTPGHTCARTCDTLNIPLPRGNCPGPIIADVCLATHGCPSALNHSNFFSFSQYRLPSYLKNRKHIRRALSAFSPMPVLVLYPAIVHRIEKYLKTPGYHNLVVNLEHENGLLWVNSYKYISETHAHRLHKPHAYRIKSLSKEFVHEYSRRARKTAMHHFKMTFYHLVHA